MDKSATSVASNESGSESVPVYRKPQLKKLGGVADLTRASSTFSNIADSSNVLGSDYS